MCLIVRHNDVSEQIAWVKYVAKNARFGGPIINSEWLKVMLFFDLFGGNLCKRMLLFGLLHSLFDSY